jgi:hypothetical protein
MRLASCHGEHAHCPNLLPILQEAAMSGKSLDVHDLNQGLTMDFVSSYLSVKDDGI